MNQPNMNKKKLDKRHFVEQQRANGGMNLAFAVLEENSDRVGGTVPKNKKTAACFLFS